MYIELIIIVVLFTVGYRASNFTGTALQATTSNPRPPESYV